MANGCIRRVNRRRRGAIPLPRGAPARFAGCVALALLGLAPLAADALGVVTVSQPWVRPAGAHAATPAYLVLGSSEAATLVAVRSPLGEVALMRGAARIGELALPAGAPLAMSAQGPHLLLRGLARSLARGERVPLTLVLRDAAGAVQEIDVSAEVRLRSPIDDERRAHGH